jgi:hypothetical protein
MSYKIAVDKALATLGIKVPSKLPHIAKKLFKVRFLLRGKIDQDIQWMPIIDDQVNDCGNQNPGRRSSRRLVEWQ